VVGYPGSASRRRSSWNGESQDGENDRGKIGGEHLVGGRTDIPCHGPVPNGR
jgi:hypothetical protein